jgi:hypothetical protein
VAFEQMTPSGINAEVLTPSKVPVQRDRDFFNVHPGCTRTVPEAVIVPSTAQGNPMSPIELATGVPLPIVTPKSTQEHNRHHAHFYKYMYQAGNMGQQAVRLSRLQNVPISAHHWYHHFFDGTMLPATDAEAYTITVLNQAGYIPDFGVKIANKQATISELTGEEKKKLRRPSTFTSETQADAQIRIGQFLMYYALSQDFDRTKELLIEEFLGITDKDMQQNEVLRARKLQLGMKLTNSAIGRAVDPINKTFQQARKSYSLRKHSPPTPWEVVKRALNGHEPDYFETLENRLASEFGVAA